MAKEPEQSHDPDTIVPNDPASVSFVRALVARGEAVRVPPGGTLPPGATHEIVGETPDGVPVLKRRRFSGGY